MPQVPYQAYPTDHLQDVPLRVDTPGEAFGVGAARAVSDLGRQVSGAGSELWQRAVAMKELENETEAEQGNLRLMSEAGDLHARFNALQGEERNAAFPKYKQDLLDLHARIRSSLSNDDSRRKFDRPSLYTIGHSIFNGAGAAATGLREWAGKTADSTMEMAIKSIEDDPTNDDHFERKKAEIRAAAEKSAEIKHGAGPGSPIAEDLVMKGISTATRQRILKVNDVDPFQAGKMQDEANSRKELTGTDDLVVGHAIRSQ